MSPMMNHRTVCIISSSRSDHLYRSFQHQIQKRLSKIYSIVSIKKTIVLDQVIAYHVKAPAIKPEEVSSIPGSKWWKTSMESSGKVFSGLHIETMSCAYP